MMDMELKNEGKYLNGIISNGKGKEYDNDNHLIYEGGFLNYRRDGEGKEYDNLGRLLFEGQLKNGNKYTGEGYKYINKYIKIKYKYLSGINLNIDNEIIRSDANGVLIENTKNYIKELFEIFYISNYVEEDFIEKKNIIIYKGGYLNGKRHGKGIEYNDKGKIVYEGGFKNGERDGFGSEYNEKYNIVYEGGFKNGKKDGNGKEYNEQGNVIYEGGFNNGKKDGKGIEFNEKGDKIFEGIIKAGKNGMEI